MTATAEKLQPGRYDVSSKLFANAQKLLPGGVNSPVRAFGGVGGTPVFMAGAEGAIVQDMDGNQYVDYVGSWGPMLLGHANPQVIEAIKTVAETGTSFGAPTDRETTLADYLCDLHPAMEMVRLVNSGTEATMSAIRLARGYTGRERIIKCDGCYHGHGDSLLVAAGSGAATHGIPGSGGVPQALAALTSVVPFNDLAAMQAVFEAHPNDIAAVIIEPLAGNMGFIQPAEGYLQGLRDLCTKYGAVLIFDEVMTGLRVAKGSAQGLYNITPDLSCFGKIIGGGLPLAAYGGKKEIMQQLAPLGPVYQAGTLSGNPLAVVAGLATLSQLNDAVYATLADKTAWLCNALQQAAARHGVAVATAYTGGMFGLFFSGTLPQNFTQVKATDTERFKAFFHGMLDRGIYWPPSAFEACFMSTQHTQDLLQHTVTAADEVFASL